MRMSIAGLCIAPVSVQSSTFESGSTSCARGVDLVVSEQRELVSGNEWADSFQLRTFSPHLYAFQTGDN